MKKYIALLLAVMLVLAFAGCAKDDADANTGDTDATVQTGNDTATGDTTNEGDASTAEGDTTAAEGGTTTEEVTVMTHAEYMAAEVQSEVTVECYVQDAQGWWFDSSVGHGVITVYAQDENGGYFLYNMACEEEDAAKLVPGTKIRVTGYKAVWEGEVEITEATFEIVEGEYIAEPVDLTDKLAGNELINYQNMLASFTGMTVEEISYKNGEPGDDIYVTVSKDGVNYSFCVEVYLTGTDSDVYTTVGELEVGDVIDIQCFLYWYQGPNPHITGITVASSVLTHAEYMAAELDAEVVVECYVQDAQGWWFDSSVGHGVITIYAQDENGGYFLYNMACEEEDAAKLVPGTKIRVTGYKAVWEGEVEITEATFEIVEGEYIAEPIDLTDKLGTDELINYQNMLAFFTGMTVEEISYKNGEPGDDIYVTVSKDGVNYSFCVEVYLTGTDSDVYTTVGELEVGDVIDIQCFLYWYQGPNPHITAVSAAE